MLAVEAAVRAAGGRRLYVDTSMSPAYARTRNFYARCGYALAAELNVLQYVPAEVTIRNEGSFVPLARVLLAAKRAGARVNVSSATPLPNGVDHVVETADEWLARVTGTRPSRVRLVGADASALYARNVLDFLKLIVTKEGALNIDMADDIVAACLMTRDGQLLRQ